MSIAIKLFAALKDAASFAVRRPKDALIIALAVLLAIFGWRLNREKSRSQELAAKSVGLPADTKQIVTIYRDRVVTKWRDGPSKIEYRDRYLPPEGHVEIVTKESQPEKPPEVVIKDQGFTKRFGGGVVYSRKALLELDMKWLYWRRYGLSLGLTTEFAGLGISRHVDDIVPFNFDNLEMLGMAGLDWRGQPRFGLGLRTNF